MRQRAKNLALKIAIHLLSLLAHLTPLIFTEKLQKMLACWQYAVQRRHFCKQTQPKFPPQGIYLIKKFLMTRARKMQHSVFLLFHDSQFCN